MSKDQAATHNAESEKAKTGTEVIDHNPATSVANYESLGFKVKKRLTMPQLKFEDHGMQLAVEITGKMYVGKEIEPKAGEAKQKPPVLMPVRYLVDGNEYELIAGAVIEDNLNAEYPNHTYVGKFFAFAKSMKANGKRYNNYQIAEIEQG